MKTITIKSKDFEIIISGQIEMQNCTFQQLGEYPITLEREDNSEMMIVKILDAAAVSKRLYRCDYCEKDISEGQGIHICRACSL